MNLAALANDELLLQIQKVTFTITYTADWISRVNSKGFAATIDKTQRPYRYTVF